MSPGYPFNVRSKGQRSRSRGAKHITVEGDRVAVVSLHSIECQPSSFICVYSVSFTALLRSHGSILYINDLFALLLIMVP